MTPDNAVAVTVHPAWLPDAALAPLRDLPSAVLGSGPCLDTVRAELGASSASGARARLVVAPVDAVGSPSDVGLDALPEVPPGGHAIVRTADRTVLLGSDGPAALRGLYALAREAAVARMVGRDPAPGTTTSAPEQPLRMLDHWDNMTVHPVMGQIERGYAGGSLFYADGAVRADLSRVRDYARLLAATGVEAVGINNVNVHAVEARLLTDGLPDVARIADVFRAYGIRIFLSVSFASPRLLGGLPTADPLDPDVASWWASTADRVYAAVPDFGGFLVKADSEGQPGPFAYGRSHAEGANMLAAALGPHGGTVLWRAFVYNHHQDWRDRTTDRARASYDHFAPLDGTFADNVVLQVKHGPMDFQVREPLSPVLAAMPRTRLAIELQVTQEYTGQQRHVCYLAPAWREYLRLPLDGSRAVASIVAGAAGGPAGGVAAVSNVGDDAFWTGHPLAQANLYAFGRLAWDSTLTAEDVLDEWIALTFAGPDGAVDLQVRQTLHAVMDHSWRTYESYTAPLGVGFMVSPLRAHYGPDVDGYEYSKWGTYHFADRDGVGVDRTRATGTGFTGQYPAPWRAVYEDLATCPDELLLFFHHVPYTHVLHSGTTVIQHIYDTHFDGVERVRTIIAAWETLEGKIAADVDARVRDRLAEQLRSATEWRDQINTYFLRKSGVPDAHGRTIH